MVTDKLEREVNMIVPTQPIRNEKMYKRRRGNIMYESESIHKPFVLPYTAAPGTINDIVYLQNIQHL